MSNKKTASVQSHGSSISSNHNSSTESIPGASAESKRKAEVKENIAKDDDVISLFTPKKVTTVLPPGRIDLFSRVCVV